MAKLLLEVPEDVVAGTRLAPDELEAGLLRELARALCRRGVVSAGKARELARMSRWEFEELLGERRVLRHYADADLREDIRYASGRE